MKAANDDYEVKTGELSDSQLAELLEGALLCECFTFYKNRENNGVLLVLSDPDKPEQKAVVPMANVLKAVETFFKHHLGQL